MRTGVTVSVLAHAALLAWGIYGLQASVPTKIPDIEGLPVELVSAAELTDLAKGNPAAELQKQAALADPTPALTPDPTPPPDPVPAPAPPAPDTPPPPLADATPPPVVDQTPPAPAEPPPPPAPTVTAQAPPPPPDPAPRPDPAPQPDKVAKAAPVPKPRPKPALPPVAAKDKSNFDPARIAALIDQSDKKPAPPPSDKKAGLGTATGKPDAKMTESAVDAIRQKVISCLARWTLPQGWTDPAEVRSVIKFSLQQDGTLSGAPEVLERPAGQYSQAAPEAAMRQIFICSPFKLPPESYAVWQNLQVTFDPRSMGG